MKNYSKGRESFHTNAKQRFSCKWTKALNTCERALARAESVPIPWFVIKSRRRLGEVLSEFGRFTEAYKALDEAGSLAETCQLPYEAALCHLSAGQVLKRIAVTAETGMGNKWIDRRTIAVERLQTAHDLFAHLGAKEQVDAEALLQEVLVESKPQEPISAMQDVQGALTEREWEVSRLVAAGLTDKEIASRLYVSPRTVDHHLRSIFRKLDIHHRTVLAAFINRQGE